MSEKGYKPGRGNNLDKVPKQKEGAGTFKITEKNSVNLGKKKKKDELMRLKEKQRLYYK